jgi:hypothetical protein
MHLLTLNNAKTIKGEKKGILTGILYLAPASISGWEVCPKRSDGCTKACLYTAGHGAFTTVQTARINRTKMFFEKRDMFMDLLNKDINSLVKKAKKLSYLPTIRLNGTSDIEWTRFGIMEKFPDIRFYDYTKVANRFDKEIPENYYLTFSRNESNDDEVELLLTKNVNIAVVFDTKKEDALPLEWKNRKVIDGDVDDVRWLDEKGVIVGLRAKGRGKKDNSGFVIKTK